MEGNNRTKIAQNLIAGAAESLDLPRSLLPGVPTLQIVCGREALIENHGGVLEYSEERVRISGKTISVCILGTGLELRSMTREHIRVTGSISEIVFE